MGDRDHPEVPDHEVSIDGDLLKIPPEVVAELHVRDDKVSLAWRRLIGDLAARITAT